MPVDVKFHLPFSAPKPDRAAWERASARGVQWACEQGLIARSAKAVTYFMAMRLADVAAGFCPQAVGEDLDVITDVITWTAVCDDYFDGPVGDDPEAAGSAVIALSGITLADSVPPDGDSALGVATADLWARMKAPMSDRWRVRAGRNWRRFLRSFLAEAEARREGVVPGYAQYLALRRETMAMYLYLDAAERANRYEVPERVLASPPIRRLAQLEIDIIAHCNDVHSIEHEEARGDTHNLVLVLEKEGNHGRAEVISEIQRRVRALSEEFLRIATRVPDLCAELNCTEAERSIAERHVSTMARQIRVTHDWSVRTRRYVQSATEAAPNSPGAQGQRPQYLVPAREQPRAV